MNALIFANGVPPSRTLARRIAGRADLVVCADGGANHAGRLALRPDVILGDLDSIRPSVRKRFSGVTTLRIADQNSTDLEKAIRYCLRRRCSSIDVLGATGGRIDHTAGNLGCFKKFGYRCALTFIDDDGELSMVGKRISLQTRKRELISLIPLERCTGVTTKNLLYPLRNGALELGVREGTSNRATGRAVIVSVRTGTLLVYRRHLSRRA